MDISIVAAATATLSAMLGVRLGVLAAESGEGHIAGWPSMYMLIEMNVEDALDRDQITMYLASIALTVCAQGRINTKFSGVS